MKRYILITSLLMLICLSISAQKKETSEYFAALGEKALAAGKMDDAQNYWKQARMAKQISVEEICLGGDIYLKQNDQPSAIKQFKRAIFFDRHNPLGYNKLANLLKKTDFEQAVALLDTLKGLRPDLKVDARIADLYYDVANYDGAMKVFETMKRDTMSDLTLTHYTASAYFAKQYPLSLELAMVGHIRNSRNFLYNRMRLYNCTELEKYPDAIAAANDLFNNSDSLKVQYIDYLYYGYALNGGGRSQEAIGQFDKAVELSAVAKVDITSQISDAYLRIKRYDEAALYYKKFVDAKKDNNNQVYDTYHLGYIWWQKAVGDTLLSKEEKAATFKKATEYFHQLSVLEPNNYIGYYWEAKVNTMLDENYKLGLAKPFYGKVIEICEKDGSHQSAMIEACKYMSYFNYLKKNYKGAYDYAQKILAIDPNDSYAFQISQATEAFK